MHQPYIGADHTCADMNIISVPLNSKNQCLDSMSDSSYRTELRVSFENHFSNESCNFSGSILKKLANRITKGRLIPLAVGRPRADLYPWHSQSDESGVLRHAPKESLQSLPMDIARVDVFSLAESLDYGHVNGSQAFIRFLTKHIEKIHAPCYDRWETSLTCGTTSALEILLRMFCNRGATVLTEKFTYPGFVECTKLLGINVVGIDMDENGLVPDSLEHVLRTWHTSCGPKPRVLYTIPSGQNPTGTTMSINRKRAIYAIAQTHDVLIIEDDPYFFLRTNLDNVLSKDTAPENERASVTTYLESLPQSFLSIDVSGRVIRLDSASKIIAPGMRMGWITAHKSVIEKFEAYSEVSTCGVAGPSQFMLWELLGLTWGQPGFFSWLAWLSSQYSYRLRLLLDACEAYLPKQVCSWSPPMNGMFIWIKLDLRQHPSFDTLGGEINAHDVERSIQVETLNRGVMVTPGSLFDVTKSSSASPTLFFRLTCAAAADEEFEAGVKIFADVVREVFGISLRIDVHN